MKLSKFLFKALFLGFLAVLGILIPFLIFGTEVPFSDDFESYPLESLSGKGGWSCYHWDRCLVNTNVSHSPNQSVRLGTELTKSFDPVIVGNLGFWLYIPSGWSAQGVGTDFILWVNQDFNNYLYFRIECLSENCKLRPAKEGQFLEPIYFTFSDDTWYQIGWGWDANDESWEIYVNQNSVYSTTGASLDNAPFTDVRRIQVNANLYIYPYLDDFGTALAVSPKIEGISPDSGTSITNLNTTITIKYSGFDWDTYDGFIVNFKDNKILAVANSVQFLEADLNPSGNGEKVINLQDFGIDTNGIWYLTALGFGTRLEIVGGMYLTTRGYIDFWTDELVSPSYYLIFNVEALPSPYTFTEPTDWYSANVERFDEPTMLFSSFVGLLSPAFEKVSEFGLRVQNMFDKSQAYDRGYGLGEIFPLINGYIQKIDLFFGGFPLASFFKYLILTMLAIFIIRMIMKFIPFLG